MPVNVVLDHPRRHIVRRVWQRLSALVGAILLTMGLIASIAAVPTSIAAVSFVVGWIATSDTDPDPWPSPDVPVREILLAWAVSTPITIVGLRGGIRLLRGHRRLVLFLRRFGYDDATSAVTFAVAKTIGHSWRLATLDDAEIAPLGVPVVTDRFFRAGRTASSMILKLGQVPTRVFPMVVGGMWAVVAITLVRPVTTYARGGTPNWKAWFASIQPYLDIVFTLLQLRLPFHAVGPNLPGVFALLGITAALMFAGMIVVMAAILLALPLSTVLLFFSSTSDAVRAAERSKVIAINTVEEIRRASSDVAARSRKVFGPRLVVLRVATAIWQMAVSQLAAVSDVCLIDLSEPTENLLWEIEELTKRFGARCVIIGHYDHVMRLAGLSSDATSSTSLNQRVARLLDGSEVLAYTTDRQGMRRFARALRGTLMSLHSVS